jgi:cysteinyl-tRNA synthetase
MHRHLGNFVAVKDALIRYNPDVIRLFILSAHYRTPSRWTDEAVEAAGRGLERLRTALANADAALERAPGVPVAGPLAQRADAARATFERAMDDDFGTPGAIASLFDLAAELNRAAGSVLQGDRESGGGLATAAMTLRTLAGALGLRFAQAPLAADISAALARMLGALRVEEPALFSSADAPADGEGIVRTLLAGRDQARLAKRFGVADSIRLRLGELGIVVEDLPGGSRWRVTTRRDVRT